MNLVAKDSELVDHRLPVVGEFAFSQTLNVF